MSHPEVKERWSTTTSVALLLSNREWGTGFFYKELVLVRQRKSGQWGLVAGNLERGETSDVAAWRELKEETGLDHTLVEILGLRNPKLIEIPSETKTSIGLIFEAYMREPISPDGYKPDSPEIDCVKPFSLEEVKQLIAKPGVIYKSEFNQILLNYWLWSYLDLKYAFEGREFAKTIAQGWGLDERVFAGPEGFEPPVLLLESSGLPLTDGP